MNLYQLTNLLRENSLPTMGRNDGEPWCMFAGCITCCGIIILIVGGIGYPIAKHDNGIFDRTICNITNHQELDTKSCQWCDEYCSSYSCGTDNNKCCRSCHYVQYTCFRAIWDVEYKSLDDDNCDNIITDD